MITDQIRSTVYLIDPYRSRKCDYRPVQPVLVVIGGLPATGKTTIGRILAAQSRTPYLRVDRI